MKETVFPFPPPVTSVAIDAHSLRSTRENPDGNVSAEFCFVNETPVDR